MNENDGGNPEAPASKDSQMPLSGNKGRSLNSSTPEGDAVFDMDDPEEEEESDALDTAEPRESAPSPAEPCDESAPKRCVYDGCSETSTLGAKQRKPWMCKKHRNKMYKDKYKKKKSDQAMASGKLEEGSEERPVSVTKQRLGAIGERPTRPSLMEQVLNQKRLSLLRSPEVISFLQQQQRLLTMQTQSQRQDQQSY
ncbi:regulatory factor X-associated protein isoform X1 [Neoarius graeffei]|uniref:regulatory factor X-associated protein isoform X1 n=1 Tax=Neoarius graeffei TaxID=443677 RepID=UPI00298C71F7|nr:regulatory factor X-associated protein isoform X1 [Neoarius graeffei]